MATIPFTLGGSNTPPLTFSVKRTGDATERFVSQAAGVITFTPVIGVLSSYTVRVTDAAGCNASSDFSLCCPATGGVISGNLTPNQNNVYTYTVSGITGSFSEVGSNGGFSIIGGTATFASVPVSGSGVASVNVGSSSFQLCYNIRSCGIERSICVTIVPAAACLIVSSVAVTCSVGNPVFRERFTLSVTGGSGNYQIRYKNPFTNVYGSWISFSGSSYVDDNMNTTSGGTVPDQVVSGATDERVKYTIELRDQANFSCITVFDVDYLVDLPNDQIYADVAKTSSLGFVHDSLANLLGVKPRSTNHDCATAALGAATFAAYNRNGVKIGTLTTNSSGVITNIAP